MELAGAEKTLILGVFELQLEKIMTLAESVDLKIPDQKEFVLVAGQLQVGWLAVKINRQSVGQETEKLKAGSL